MTMIETAEIVAERYQITRERQDEFALQSHVRTAAAQAAGRFDAEVVPLPSVMKVVDKATQAVSDKAVTLKHDEGVRADTSLRVSPLKPVFADGQRVKAGSFITAGNASQLSDSASACVLMEAGLASQRNLTPLGVSRGCGRRLRPGRDGDRPSVRRAEAASKRTVSRVDDIGLWELNEAFASQALFAATSSASTTTSSMSTAARLRSATPTA